MRVRTPAKYSNTGSRNPLDPPEAGCPTSHPTERTLQPTVHVEEVADPHATPTAPQKRHGEQDQHEAWQQVTHDGHRRARVLLIRGSSTAAADQPAGRGVVAVDSNGDSNRPRRGQPPATGRGQLPEVAEADGHRQTERAELTSEGSWAGAVSQDPGQDHCWTAARPRWEAEIHVA
jgi:hypothetical protein